MSLHVSNFVCELYAPWNSIIATLDRLRATARAEVAAEDFYTPNTPVICSAHILGIADPAMHRGIADPSMYRQCTGKHKYQSDLKHTEDKPSKRTKVGDMVLGHESYQAIQFRNCQRKQERWEVTLRHDAGNAPSNEVGESRSLKEKVKDQIRAIQAARRKAQDTVTLAYERATFRADCAARNIRTADDAERAWIRIAVARAEVVRQEI